MISRKPTTLVLAFLAMGIFGGMRFASADLIGSTPEAEEVSAPAPRPALATPVSGSEGGASTADVELRERLRGVGLSSSEADQRVAALSPAEREAVARDPRQVQVAGVYDWLIGLGISFAVMIFRWLFGF